MGAKSLVIFNNKGGVGKTTLLCNIASFLEIKKGKRVIVVDADPQCNATAYLFPYPQIEEIYEKNSGTLFDIIKPVQKGKGYYHSSLPIIHSPRFDVDVIPGDPKLSLTEDFLSKDWVEGRGGEYRGLQTTFVFRDLIHKLQSYDYVIFDVGPSLGAINRAILLACDYFLIPMSSDIFSLRAIENISLALTDWKEGIQNGLSEYRKKEGEEFKINKNSIVIDLQFAGYITQQYTAKTVDGKKQPVNAYERIIKKIPSVIKKELGKFITGYAETDIKLGEIPNLHSLVPLSQNSSAPIFALQAKDGVVGAHFNKVREYEKVISSITTKLIKNISND